MIKMKQIFKTLLIALTTYSSSANGLTLEQSEASWVYSGVLGGKNIQEMQVVDEKATVKVDDEVRQIYVPTSLDFKMTRVDDGEGYHFTVFTQQTRVTGYMMDKLRGTIEQVDTALDASD